MNLPELTVIRKSKSAVLTSFEAVIAWKELISQVITNEKDVQPLYNAALSQVKTMETYMRSKSEDSHVYETSAALTVGKYSFKVRVIHQIPNHVREFAEEAAAAIAELYRKYLNKGHSHEDIGSSVKFDMDRIREQMMERLATGAVGLNNKWNGVFVMSP
jgi:hypothetical protein